MSKHEFIQGLRAGRDLLLHRVHHEHSNGGGSRRRTADAAVWLTPATVRGFEADDFPELSHADRRELERNVQKFERVAEQVWLSQPASAREIAAAQSAFRSILKVMDPYLPTDEETRKLRKALKAVRFPDAALTWVCEFGQDSTGDPAVWIWVIVDDEAADDPAFTNTTIHLQRDILIALQKAGIDRWPYLRFHTASEQKELQAVGQ
jgi:hypothetical protein